MGELRELGWKYSILTLMIQHGYLNHNIANQLMRKINFPDMQPVTHLVQPVALNLCLKNTKVGRGVTRCIFTATCCSKSMPESLTLHNIGVICSIFTVTCCTGLNYIIFSTHHLNSSHPTLPYSCAHSTSWTLQFLLIWLSNWPLSLHFCNTPTLIFLHLQALSSSEIYVRW